MYNIIFTNRAAKDFKSLDPITRERIASKVKILESSPFVNSVKLRDTGLGSYRIKIGDYRVIYDIDGDNVVILRIGHRKEIYR